MSTTIRGQLAELLNVAADTHPDLDGDQAVSIQVTYADLDEAWAWVDPDDIEVLVLLLRQAAKRARRANARNEHEDGISAF